MEDYSKLIELYPSHFTGYNNRGDIKNTLLDHKGAIADFSTAIAINPKYALAYANRGETYILTDQKNKGCVDLAKAKELGFQKAEELIKKYCE